VKSRRRELAEFDRLSWQEFVGNWDVTWATFR